MSEKIQGRADGTGVVVLCGQRTCLAPATTTVWWPGAGEVPGCDRHAERMQAVAEVMGLGRLPSRQVGESQTDPGARPIILDDEEAR